MSKSLRTTMAEKIVKASNTNGIKQGILGILMSDCMKRRFNKFEALNAINAIPRTKFFVKGMDAEPPYAEFKYRIVRWINKYDVSIKYKIEYLQGRLIFYTY
jgi:hypothetical protein